MRALWSGSPPHGRGKVCLGCGPALLTGITPAWAGKSPRHDRTQSEYRDHPRMGGEKLLAMKSRATFWGSPPRRQGKANWHCVRRPALRITPAHAGKRTRSWRAYGCPWDHPRVGGEKSTFLNSMSFPPGSPPRRRGKVPNARCFIERQRITPAWAGKSAFRFQSQKASQDHPRVGGEKLGRMAVAISVIGSPPRGRGKVKGTGQIAVRSRITPAWAEKSFSTSPKSCRAGDHPRMGGEKSAAPFSWTFVTGSPPRRRGKVEAPQVYHRRGGITPAWAGKSPASQPWSPPLWMMVIRPRP